MIEIELPKDITKYEAKLGGVATKRQVVCVGLAAILGYFARSLCDYVDLPQYKNPAMVFLAIIPILFVACEPYGMKLEEFLEQAFINNILAPTKRKYQVENVYAQQYEKMLKEEKAVIGAYNKVYGIRVPQRKINDPKDKPRQKPNRLNPELTGYL